MYSLDKEIKKREKEILRLKRKYRKMRLNPSYSEKKEKMFELINKKELEHIEYKLERSV